MSVDGWMDKENMTHTYTKQNTIQPLNKTDILTPYNVDEP